MRAIIHRYYVRGALEANINRDILKSSNLNRGYSIKTTIFKPKKNKSLLGDKRSFNRPSFFQTDVGLKLT